MFLCACAAPAAAQSFSVGIEAARDRFTYHFDNPSAFDTQQLVPHFFEQTYVADNLWLVASLRYTAGIPWETSGAVTLRRALPATDYDTFFDPDGTVIVAGTSGDAEIHSMRVSQRGELGRSGPVTFVAGYLLRYDRASFLVGHKTVTRNARVVEAFDVTTPEITSSLVQEFFFGAKVGRDVGSGWRMTIGGEAAPTTTGRLAIELPEKYPGAQFIFVATSLAGAGRLTFSRAPNRRPIEISIDVAHTWHYSSENYLSRDRVSARLSVGF
ncbi:MAG TPA: hypothetical protein VGY57_01425 [Vicinamibacterales bacterium]|nr:hypothetical protein [Vicinamibacterales bacterium]